jgi:type VI protein secretion system component VasK
VTRRHQAAVLAAILCVAATAATGHDVGDVAPVSQHRRLITVGAGALIVAAVAGIVVYRRRKLRGRA